MKTRKLSLHKETLRHLNIGEQNAVQGGTGVTGALGGTLEDCANLSHGMVTCIGTQVVNGCRRVL